jgi:hypothetical protein
VLRLVAALGLIKGESISNNTVKKESSVQVAVSPPKLGQVSALRSQSISKASVIVFTLVFFLCGAIRFAWLSIDFGSLSGDPDAYAVLAEGLASSGTLGHVVGTEVYATAYRPPGYIWFLSWLVVEGQLSDFRVHLLHGFLGVLTCILVARIAHVLSRSQVVAAFACLAVAVDPILLKQSSLVMTETLATFIAVVLWWSWIELTKVPRSTSMMMLGMLVVGLFAGFGCLVRPTTFVWIALWFVVSMCLVGLVKLRLKLLGKESSESQSSSGAAICYSRQLSGWFSFLVGVAIVVGPWAYRNSIQIGQWTLTTTHGGYTLLLANNPVLYANIQKHGWDREWDETRFHFLWDQRSHSDPRIPEFWNGEFVTGEFDGELNRESNRESNSMAGFQFARPDEHREVADDRLATEVAWKTIRRAPSTFMKSCLVQMSWFWAVAPYRSGAASVMIIAIGLWYSVLFAGIVVTSGVLVIQKWGKGRRGNARLMDTEPMALATGVDIATDGQVAPEASAIGSGQNIYASFSHKADEVLVNDMPSLGLWVPAFSLVVSLQLVHLIFWSNMRMRAPLMPVLYILFAVGLFFAFESIRRGKSLIFPITPSN